MTAEGVGIPLPVRLCIFTAESYGLQGVEMSGVIHQHMFLADIGLGLHHNYIIANA